MQKFYYYFLCSVSIITIFILIFQQNNFMMSVSYSPFFWPTPSYHGISSYFGYRDKPTHNASSYHRGIDILAPEGSGVSTIEAGTVTYAGWDHYGGYMIKIQHSQNLQSLYEHLSPNLYVAVRRYGLPRRCHWKGWTEICRKWKIKWCNDRATSSFWNTEGWEVCQSARVLLNRRVMFTWSKKRHKNVNKL